MKSAVIKRKENDQASRSAARDAPAPDWREQQDTPAGAAAGLPLFLTSGRQPATASPPSPPSSGPGPAATVQRETLAEEEEPLQPAGTVQPRLLIGAADDPQEREADQVAERVLRAPATPFRPMPRKGQRESGQPAALPCFIRRLCPACPQELPEEDLSRLSRGTIRRKANGEQALPPAHPVAALLHSPTGGSALPSHVRQRSEQVLGVDLSHVKVHHSPATETAAHAINARAFTHGHHIYLGSGQSAHDVGLMAHETAHVAQQSGAAPAAAAAIQRLPGDNEGGFWSSVGEGIAAGGLTLLEYGEAGAAAVGEGIGGVVEAGGEAVAGAAGMAREAIIALLEERAPGALAFFRGLRDFVSEGVTAGFDGIFSGVAAHYEEGGLGGALEYIFVDLAGSALRGIGSFAAGACSALGDAAQWLLDAGARLGAEAMAAVSAGAAAVAGFLNGLWERYGAPAAEAIRGFIGGIWDSITETVSAWWDRLEPVRTAAGEVWDWLVSTILAGMRSLNDLLTGIFAWAVEKWDEIKEWLRPFMGYVRALAVVLLLVSPMGPFIVAGAAAYGLYRLVQYLWQVWGRPLTAEIRQYLVDEVLPQIMTGITFLEEKIDAAGQWLAGLAGQLTALGAALLEAIGVLPVLRLAQQAIAAIYRQMQHFAERVGALVSQVADAVGQFLRSAWQFLQPVLEFLRQVILVGLVGPWAILDDGVWASVNRIAAFAMSVPCIRELAGLMQLPTILEYAARFRTMMQSAWQIIRNPEPIWQALHDALAPMIENVPALAAGIMARLIYPYEEEHRRGVEAHLLPAVEHLQNNWWEELKKMGWTLLWPWDEVGERFPLLLQHGWEAITNLFDLEIGAAIDNLLLMAQDVNTVLGAVWGWFALAAMLIGGVLGALGVEFTAGASIGAGIAAGWALAEQVGIGLLVSVAATEMGIIGKSMFDIRFTNQIIRDDAQRGAANDGDYTNIANSTFTLAVVTALVVLGALAGKLASSIWSRVRGHVPRFASLEEFLNRPRGGRSGEPAPGETPAGGRPAEPAPADLARTNDLLRQQVRDPNNVRPVADAELSARYDVEVRVGDHVYRRSRSTGTWCRFSTPTCGIELGDVNAAVDAALPKAEELPPEVAAETTTPGSPEALTTDPSPATATGGDLVPGSPAHKAARWAEYLERRGADAWEYERWSNVYERNMVRARLANEAADAYRQQLGWGNREVTVDVEGVPRRLDIADPATRRAVEVKTGDQYLTQDNGWEIMRDRVLVEQGWDITWHFDGHASAPLLRALHDAGITVSGI